MSIANSPPGRNAPRDGGERRDDGLPIREVIEHVADRYHCIGPWQRVSGQDQLADVRLGA